MRPGRGHSLSHDVGKKRKTSQADMSLHPIRTFQTHSAAHILQRERHVRLLLDHAGVRLFQIGVGPIHFSNSRSPLAQLAGDRSGAAAPVEQVGAVRRLGWFDELIALCRLARPTVGSSMSSHITCRNPPFASIVSIVRGMLISSNKGEGVRGRCRSVEGYPRPTTARASSRYPRIAVRGAHAQRIEAPA